MSNPNQTTELAKIAIKSFLAKYIWIIVGILSIIAVIVGVVAFALSAINSISPYLNQGKGSGCEDTAYSSVQNKINSLPTDSPQRTKIQNQFDSYKGRATANTNTTNSSGLEGQTTSCKSALIMGDGVITWPVPGAPINERYPCYGWPNSCSPHTGMDIGGGFGAPILAAVTGTVVEVSDGTPDYLCLPYKYNIFSCPYTKGNYVKIKHSDGWIYWYHHLKNGTVLPKVGDYVTAGTKIAEEGSSGVSTGAHLHFELKDDKGRRQDPLKYLQDNGCANCPAWINPGYSFY